MQPLPEKRNKLNKDVHTYADKVKMDGQTTLLKNNYQRNSLHSKIIYTHEGIYIMKMNQLKEKTMKGIKLTKPSIKRELYSHHTIKYRDIIPICIVIIKINLNLIIHIKMKYTFRFKIDFMLSVYHKLKEGAIVKMACHQMTLLHIQKVIQYKKQ